MSKKIDKEEIMQLFFNNSNKEFHIRETAKIVKVSPMTASKYLENFSNQNILLKKEERNHVLYRANSENRIFKEEKKHYNIKKILESGLIEHLEESLNFPKAIILFGSFAKGENSVESDIDLFILTESKEKVNLGKFENKLKTKIQLFSYSRKQFQELKKKNKELLNNIVNGIKLSGFLEVI